MSRSPFDSPYFRMRYDQWRTAAPDDDEPMTEEEAKIENEVDNLAAEAEDALDQILGEDRHDWADW